MRITFVLPWVNLSGGIRVIAIYAELLQSMGHRVVLVSPMHKHIDLLSRLKSLLRRRSWSHRITDLTHIAGRNLDHRILESYRPVVDADVPDADIVIATWWGTAEWVNDLSASKGKKIYFVQHHPQHHEFQDAELKSRARATYQLPLHKIVISAWLQRAMLDEFGDADVDLVVNSVDHRQFFATARSKQTNPTIGYLYSPADCKGIDILLKAIVQIRREFPDLRVYAFGAHKLAEKTRRVYCDKYVYKPPQHQIRDIYAACDVWLTCSRAEGFNLPAMEAMACRTPVVSTRTGWPDDAIIDGRNGYLAAIDNWQEVAQQTTKILSLSNNEWQDMSQHASSTVSDSTWEASAQRFATVLDKINCAAPRSGDPAARKNA